nr:MAG TPA: hypothetical protein [Caudoviricetes sp.]
MFKHVIYEKRCAMCGKKFDATNAKTMYCSKLGMSYGAYVARQEAGTRG